MAELTDHNGDPYVSRILDIIDEKHSRYLVAQAVAEWVKSELQATESRAKADADADARFEAAIGVDSPLPEPNNANGNRELKQFADGFKVRGNMARQRWYGADGGRS